MRRVMRSMAYAMGGLALLSAAVVLPDGLGRTGPAVAEVIHDGTDTTGVLHAAIDCDRATPGTQDHCFVLDSAPALKVDVTVGNTSGSPSEMTLFYAPVRTNELLLDPLNREPTVYPKWDSNPDFNQALVPVGGASFWTCGGPPVPQADYDSNPAVALSFIICNGEVDGGADIILPATPVHTVLATLEYDVVGTAGTANLEYTYFEIDDVHTTGGYDYTIVCGTDVPALDVVGLCFGATVEVVPAAGDYDGDGVANAVDNCIGIANADQHNADGNLFVQIPTLGVNDLSWANSDNMGNACDDDDDNDGLSDAQEGIGCSASGPSSAIAFDTDGDRYFDGAECARGTDPVSAASKPTAASCGSTADVDGDRLMERIERCHYNTDPTVKDSDGDGMKDGCEAASLNGDGVVNSADQLLFSLQHLSVLAGFGAFANTDINKDGNYNSIDQLQMAFLIIPSGQCP